MSGWEQSFFLERFGKFGRRYNWLQDRWIIFDTVTGEAVRWINSEDVTSLGVNADLERLRYYRAPERLEDSRLWC